MSLSIDTINSTLQQANYLFAQTLHDEFITLEYNSNSDYESKSKFNTDELFNITESLQYRVDRSLIDEVSIDLYKRLQRFVGSNNVDVSFSATYDPPSGTIIVPNSSFSTFLSLLDTPNSYTGQSNKVVSVKTDETGLEFTFPSTGVISDATNGLHIDGTLAKLGGSLIENTTISLNSNTLKFNSKWIEYVNDFSSTSSSNSRAIPDVGWVTSQINANDIFFRTNSLLGTGTSIDPYAPNATNGLSVSNGFGIQLGGSLLGNTNIITTGYGLSLTSNSSTAVPFTIKGTIGSTPSISLESTDTVDGRNTIRFSSTRTSSQIWEFGQNPAGTNNIFGLRNVSSTTLPTVDIVWATDSTSNTTTFNFPLILAPSTSAASGLTLLAGTTDTSSTDGSIWYDGIHLFGYLNGGVVQIDGGGSGGSWGTITGTLSSQTDLQSALDNKQDILTFNNGGIVNNSGNIEIGGTIIGGRSLNLNSYAFEMFDNTSSNESDYTQYQGSIILTGGKVSTFNFGKVQISSATANLGYSANISGVQKINQIELNGMFINDQINSKGFVYGGNYRSNFTSFSLIDKGYADATYATISGSGFITSISIASSNGFTGTSSGGATPALTLTLQNATTSQAGKLTSTDWNTFNNKQTALSGTGFVKISGTTISYDNSTYLTTTSAASTYLPLSGGTLSGDVQQATSPVNATSLINKSYVDNLITGITWKQEVVCSTTANITLSGEQTIDGVTTSTSRILVKNQTTATQNGIYLTGSGSWTRTLDADSSSEIGSATVLVRNGTINKNTQWTCTNATDPVIGTDNITFGQISGAGTYTNGTGISLTSNVFSLDTTYTKGLISATSPIFYNNSTGVISSQAATTSLSGYLTSADWTSFNGKFTLPTLTNHSVLFSDGTTIAQDNSNFYYDSSTHLLSLNTNGDFGGTNSLNTYGQGDFYEPQSTIGGVTNAITYPGITASTSRGTGASPIINNTGDNIGGFSGWAYTGSSPAYTYMAGMSLSAVGATSTNLGGQIDFYTKADNASTTISRQTIANDGTITLSKYGTGVLHSSSAGVVSSSLVSVSDMSATGSATSSNFLRGDNTLTNILQQNNIIATNVDGLYLQNNTASTSGVPNQNSPSLHFGARTWNTGGTPADNWVDWINYILPSGNISSPTSQIVWASSRTTTSTPSYTTRMSLDSFGGLTVSTVVASFVQANQGLFTASGGVANFNANGGSATTTTATTGAIYAGSATNYYRVLFNGTTNSLIADTTTYCNVIFGSTPFQVGTGQNSPWAANVVIKTPGTITLVGTGTVTNSAALYIEGASTTATNNYSLYIGNGNVKLNTAPTTSASTYDVITRNTSTGVLEKVASSNLSWIQASADLTGQTAANSSIATFTVGASTGTFRVGGYLTVTAVVTDVINFQVVWTDETNTSRTQTYSPMGTTSPSVSATGAYPFSPVEIRAKNGTTITVQTVLTTGVGSITYDVGATIQQLR